MIIAEFNIKDKNLLVEGKNLNFFNYETNSGEFISFSNINGILKINIPFFLTQNIFYWMRGEILIFSNALAGSDEEYQYDYEANKLLNINGFLPLSKTQFNNVNVLCSFLEYSFDGGKIDVKLAFPYTMPGRNVSVSDLSLRFLELIKQKISQFTEQDFIIPLSGGMDSRLLLNIAIKIVPDRIRVYSTGTRRCGDIKIAKRITKALDIANLHTTYYLEDFSLLDAMKNYQRVGFLIPLDRLLGHDLSRFYKSGTILSGLYGDVIFADSEFTNLKFSEYLSIEGFNSYDSLDSKIINEYDNLPKYSKLYRTLLRCQKLTKETLCALNSDFKIIAPFIDPQIIMMASEIGEKNLYPKIIRTLMDKNLSRLLHQSSMSYFLHPKWLRVAERKILKLMMHPYRTPYFDDKYLNDVQIKRDFSPKPEFIF